MSDTEAGRRRAPGMHVDERRRMIVEAALPLIVEHGTAVTTNQIARAAAIGEATIFRAFQDKDELLDACILKVTRPDGVVRAIDAIPAELPLAQRLRAAADAMSAHLDRLGALLGALHATGRRHRGEPGRTRGKDARRESMAVIRDALVRLLEPDAERLRLPAAQLAAVFLSLSFSGRRLAVGELPDTAALVDVFLNGAVGEKGESA